MNELAGPVGAKVTMTVIVQPAWECELLIERFGGARDGQQRRFQIDRNDAVSSALFAAVGAIIKQDGDAA